MKALSLLLLLTAHAHAAGFTEARFAVGARDFSLATLDAAVATASGTVMGAGVSNFSERRFSRSVFASRVSFSRPVGEQTLGAKALSYPTTSGSSAYGGSLFIQRRASESDESYEGSWGVNAGYVRHDLRNEPTAPPRRQFGFGEYALELNSRQSYWDEFNFQATLAGFLYDKNLKDIGLFRTQFNQSDIATLGTFAAMTAPPQWALSVQYSRSVEPGSPTNVVLGYSRFGLQVAGAKVNSYLLGVQTKIGGSATGQIGWNMVKATQTNARNYWGATASFYWK